MSGRRHHFIPQFLQRGFASHYTSKDSYTWVYRKGDINPFNSNIKNIGIESDFYSEDKETTLDENITDAETKFGLFVDELRKADLNEKVDKSKAAKLIAHLEVRTKNLRINYRNAGTYAVNETAKFLENTDNCEKFIRGQVKTQVNLMIDEELSKRNIARTLFPIFRNQIAPLVEQKIPEMTENMIQMMKYVRENLPSLFNKSAKSGHIKALLNTHTPPIKVKVYEKLSYKIISTGNYKIPLGDSSVIFNIDEEREFKPFFEKGNKLIAVILPICSTRLLIGSLTEYTVNVEKVINAIASCSLDYFISSENSPSNEELSKLISQNTALLTSSEMDQILVDLMNEDS
jgi:uncharacterized protein YaaW (UPF0174 family)